MPLPSRPNRYFPDIYSYTWDATSKPKAGVPYVRPVAFAGLEGIYQMAEGERRVLVLIEILSKPVAVRVAPSALRKLG